MAPPAMTGKQSAMTALLGTGLVITSGGASALMDPSDQCAAGSVSQDGASE